MVMHRIQRLGNHFLAGYWHGMRNFPAQALQAIEAEVARAEQTTNGEIKFAIEAALHPLQLIHGMTPHQRALDVFSSLRVWDTDHNNGVLIYVLLGDRAVEIIADRGVHAKVGGPATWQRIVDAMQMAFANGDYQAGATLGIHAVAQELARQYPADGDKRNQLPDAVSVL
jgi:uncharacterized membrane protein